VSTDTIDVASTLKEVKKLLGEETVLSALKSSIDALIDIVKALTNRIGLNSYNSSKPPSTDWNKGNKAGPENGGNDNESGSASEIPHS
jgi:transposase